MQSEPNKTHTHTQTLSSPCVCLRRMGSVCVVT